MSPNELFNKNLSSLGKYDKLDSILKKGVSSRKIPLFDRVNFSKNLK